MTTTLVVGWFSFEEMGATAGDVLAADVAVAWLRETGRAVLLATAAPFCGDVSLEDVHPESVDEVVFVCGPFGNGGPIPELLARFSGSRWIGLDLSMLQPLDEWDPFDVLFARDSDGGVHPDLALASRRPKVPVIGLIEVEPQWEYGDRARHDEVGRLIREALADVEGAVIAIDTRLDRNATGLRTAQEVESLIARCDVVVTTRLHGMVLALKNGVPAVVVDPIAGGAKVTRQAAVLGWPFVYTPEDASRSLLAEAVRSALSPSAVDIAVRTAHRADESLRQMRDALIGELGA